MPTLKPNNPTETSAPDSPRAVNWEFLFPLAALTVLCFSLSITFFSVPPLGKVLNPFIGMVQNGADELVKSKASFPISAGLANGATVYFDRRQVPHIFAGNAEDLYVAQGYVTARLRLWQMDFLSYYAAGRLSEIFGEDYLAHDRNQRRTGLLDAAKASLKMAEQDSLTRRLLTAYARGVNAYIGQLKYQDLPLEYKFRDYTPEPWTNLKTILIVKYMAALLTGYEEDFNMTNLMLAMGEEKFNKYFPASGPHATPVVNDPPGLPGPAGGYLSKPGYLDFSFLTAGTLTPQNTYNPQLGSNSWVVSGKKTRSGFPILCNDPHLNLALPAVWLEMQLSAPGLNVYGVTIPGTPAVIIGFNAHIAWGLTNGGDDVKDWYKLRITDDYRKYKFDGRWRKLDFTVEEIKIKGRRSLYDTIYRAVQGPVVHDRQHPGTHPELVNHALRWGLHKPSNDLLTFIELNRAGNYREYRAAIRHYSSPVQNFTFAGPGNTIAVDHQGSMPVKWPGAGKFILDGTTSAHLFTRYIPRDSLPRLLNPASGYVLAANQRPTPPSYPYYYNGTYLDHRANRIKQLLDGENAFDVEKMKAMQLDNVSFFARAALPVLLRRLPPARLTPGQAALRQALAHWDGAYQAGDKNALLFNLWWARISEDTWDEFRQFSFYSRAPDPYVLLDLIAREPADAFFDQQVTPEVENAGDIVGRAFAAAAAQYDGLGKTGSTRWESRHQVSIHHLLRLTPFSREALPSAGYPEAINAVSESWGPSWRMVVELGPRPKAFGVFPGGQSGNVGSTHYDDFVTDWNAGRYYPLLFFASPREAGLQARHRWVLN
jgi:penicillin amidase